MMLQYQLHQGQCPDVLRLASLEARRFSQSSQSPSTTAYEGSKERKQRGEGRMQGCQYRLVS